MLGWPGGPVIVAIAGLVVIGVGAYQGYKGISRKFLEDSRTERMSQGTETGFTALGVVGHVARAVTFLLIGYGVIKAAVDYSPQSAVGLDGALQKLAHASAGRCPAGRRRPRLHRLRAVFDRRRPIPPGVTAHGTEPGGEAPPELDPD